MPQNNHELVRARFLALVLLAQALQLRGCAVSGRAPVDFAKRTTRRIVGDNSKTATPARGYRQTCAVSADRQTIDMFQR